MGRSKPSANLGWVEIGGEMEDVAFHGNILTTPFRFRIIKKESRSKSNEYHLALVLRQEGGSVWIQFWNTAVASIAALMDDTDLYTISSTWYTWQHDFALWSFVHRSFNQVRTPEDSQGISGADIPRLLVVFFSWSSCVPHHFPTYEFTLTTVSSVYIFNF